MAMAAAAKLPSRGRPTKEKKAQNGAFQSFVETQRLLGKLEKDTEQLAQDAHDRLHEMRGMKKDLRKLLRMVNRTVWIATIGTTVAGAIFTLVPMMIPNAWKQTIQDSLGRLTNDPPSPIQTGKNHQ